MIHPLIYNPPAETYRNSENDRTIIPAPKQEEWMREVARALAELDERLSRVERALALVKLVRTNEAGVIIEARRTDPKSRL